MTATATERRQEVLRKQIEETFAPQPRSISRPKKAIRKDRNLPENKQENLGEKLDHAIEETFPASDPVSVTVTR